jgi:hypothetical protein
VPTMSFKQENPYYCGPASLRALEIMLGFELPHTQDEWAVFAGTIGQGKAGVKSGTSIAGLKRGIKMMGRKFEIVKKTLTPWLGPAIVYDASRDHWMAVDVKGYNAGVWIVDPDPETPDTLWSHWIEFQEKYMNSSRNSYALVVK